MGYRVVYEFDPFYETGVPAPENARERKAALEEIADYVKTEVLDYVGEASSPVEGGEWTKKLNENYEKIKAKISSSTVANMELYGDMLDALQTKINVGKGTIEIGWFGGEQAAKADGHNNFSGESSLPLRQSIPNGDEDETFKRPIVEGMKEIALEYFDAEE